ncbi:MAG: glycosyltransferase family 61 protein [Chloroflexaceae bacterium]|nr:glycosyltransferase family 61 protein [Chloroflexaceae bacterium]
MYISRAAQSKRPTKRHIFNEEELIESLEKLGFRNYTLETISIEEKIELFYDAEIVVAAEGSGLSHILFSEAIDIVCFYPTQTIYPHFYFLSKHPQLRHNIHYLLCGDASELHVNFRVDVPRAIEQIRRLLPS